MKKYMASCQVVFQSDFEDKNAFSRNVIDRITEMQKEGLNVEVQYSTCTHNGICVYSALILGYEEI